MLFRFEIHIQVTANLAQKKKKLLQDKHNPKLSTTKKKNQIENKLNFIKSIREKKKEK